MLNKSSIAAAFAASIATLTGPAAYAAASDFRFELAGARPAAEGGTEVTIRILHAPDARPVADAVIFQHRAVMAGMEDMPAAATVAPGAQPGTYVLRVATSMAGPWTLYLAAKAQGEPDTLRATLGFEATE